MKKFVKKSRGDIWFDSEADNWFKRNKKDLIVKNDDIIISLFELYKLRPKRIIEIGCANGFRLASIHKKYKSEVIGVEPSLEAIKDGRSKYSCVKFIRAMCDSFKTSKKADLVIINFVFHWIIRKRLIKSFERIDEVLKEGGFLIIGDFGTEAFIKRKYHHLEGEKVYTYKQRYENMFTSTGLYRELARLTFNCETAKLTTNTNNSNIGTVSLLKKMQPHLII